MCNCGRTATVEIDDEAKEIKSELRVTGDGGLLGKVKLTNGVVAECWKRMGGYTSERGRMCFPPVAEGLRRSCAYGLGQEQAC